MAQKTKIKFPFGEYLKELRYKKGVSLLAVERDTGISNAYLSQLETGTRKKLPEPDRLRLIADYYNVTVQELLQKAGYFDPTEIEETSEQIIEKKFLHAISDQKFYKGRILNTEKLNIDIKKAIIEMHENFINKKYEEIIKACDLHPPHPETVHLALKKFVVENEDKYVESARQKERNRPTK
jgi:transcriptional regulator with XRE-family HTH domain